ncbi:uncharacterized protein STEHIDRAFT_163533 [Stereum hirsutum FP-91666 SS1]|uniref:FAD-binding domain-containing protein n=1 Tax=Stereum hirsutum (strain FP-91666) TaxID=721885 RepID=R7RWM5_STEHR|nr:uncharacterized protein STEHIDRAFT_163533 [Stereum hirsutum FP-91666 SS1]EIM79714.1 hypothetical protein STEHIDRAFT_163533 [Stereum hirsutum FP-91666 SS1]
MDDTDLCTAKKKFSIGSSCMIASFPPQMHPPPRTTSSSRNVQGIGSEFGGLLTFHRAEFHSVLLQRLSSRCKTFNSKRLHHYVQPPHVGAPIQPLFQDGSTATCDLVIGADGIKSMIRRKMLNEQAQQLEQRGQVNEEADLRGRVEPRLVHRTLIPADKLRQIAPQNRALSVPAQVGIGFQSCDLRLQHIMANPISHGRYINFVAFEADYSREGSLYTDPWISTVDLRALSRSFSNWELDVQQIASAHAMTPFQGAGAGQAIEATFILSSLLSLPLTTLRTLPQVLSIYSRVRVSFANKIAERSRMKGLDFALNGYHDTGNGAGMTELGERIRKIF